MADRNRRAETAIANDDKDLIESMDEAPSQSGVSGGDLQRDIASRAEERRAVHGEAGITRVEGKDKPEEADLPRFNQR